MDTNHQHIRETAKWGTFGKSGREPLKFLLIKEIHDDHLANVIPFIQRNLNHYGQNILNVMIDEQEYRRTKKIRVPFKFG